MNDQNVDVLLICPPFQYPYLSSLSIAGPAAYLREKGVRCTESYQHLEFFRIIGRDRYEEINSVVNGRNNGQTAELLFAEGLHGPIEDPELLAELERMLGSAEERKSERDRLAERVLRTVEYENPKIVGITTSYTQLVAALWTARIIKAARPNVLIVLGGSACTAPMGPRILEGYEDIDYVIGGFGEAPLLDLARGNRPSEKFIECPDPLPFEALPLPDYRPYLREAAELVPDMAPKLLFQSSRGCWWGAKKHCTFCGLNRGQMTFSAKEEDCVLSDIRTLWERHGLNLLATDSIMARNHFKNVLPKLAHFSSRPTIFYEMKANMTQPDVAAMQRASVFGQMGIESLNTRLLKIMHKGVSAIRVIGLLKWCQELGIQVVWNQLCGIPGEREEDYDEQIALMKKLPQLPPPFRANPVIIDRYSPYFDNFEAYGWKKIKPIPQYRAAHPHLSDEALMDIAYHFEGEGGVTTAAYIERFDGAVQEWKARHERGDGLFFSPYLGLLRSEKGEKQSIVINETVRRIINATHNIISTARLIEETGCDESLLSEMVENGFLYIENKNVINLAVRLEMKA